ncbi:cysteine desulfurase family protein [Bacillus altitudinis]|uniref:cysteine desulfurase family protein n=1 Tax=Bacillus altitudinis TaxID=293387 RepID=UPI0010FF9200|nr:cysteine desulfurase family protein [Bacillus altitudinis]MDF9415326.1 cysteine desulfurase [Bacillus altitudinis]MDH3109052.1 cysteine desulfurase family protein [Bacillus altitudinis]MEC2040145.1 cysteine desulfurase family protein [Bacillus altitudinis]MED4561429.1 cysteine desulfurase family protein [Bacillus altitudinis]QCU19998.1 cysteine desulfurase [Bacillus altitudinis]
MIYLDNSATTKPYPEVLQVHQQVSERFFGNPSSLHQLGIDASRLLSETRKQILHYTGFTQYEIIFTSGATEANNIAIKGAALAKMNRGRHIVTTAIEHPSVIESFEQLKTLFGFDISYIQVNEHGRADMTHLKEVLRPDTVLVSLMHVNNETGAIQPIEEAASIIRKYAKEAIFHVDGVQGIGKVPLPKEMDIDLLTMSGHKIHGLKGTGALFLKREIVLAPFITGGEQELGLRSGTENPAGAVSLAKAIKQSFEYLNKHHDEMIALKTELEQQLGKIEGVVINTPLTHSAPHIVNFSVPGIQIEVLLHMLEKEGIYVSTTSACSAKKKEPSRVLLAMGKSEEAAKSSMRISLTYGQGPELAPQIITSIAQSVKKLKGMR